MKREWQIISETGNPKKSGRYGILYRYRKNKNVVHIHTLNYVAEIKLWAGQNDAMEIVAWCEFPPIPVQFII